MSYFENESRYKGLISTVVNTFKKMAQVGSQPRPTSPTGSARPTTPRNMNNVLAVVPRAIPKSSHYISRGITDDPEQAKAMAKEDIENNFRKQFEGVVKNKIGLRASFSWLYGLHKAIIRWKKLFMSVPAGSTVKVRFEVKNRVAGANEISVDYTAKHVSMAETYFKHGLTNMYYVYRYRLKKRHPLDPPSEFNLLGPYRPVFFPRESPLTGWVRSETFMPGGQSLQQLIINGSSGTGENLPLNEASFSQTALGQGFALALTLDLLFYRAIEFAPRASDGVIGLRLPADPREKQKNFVGDKIGARYTPSRAMMQMFAQPAPFFDVYEASPRDDYGLTTSPRFNPDGSYATPPVLDDGQYRHREVKIRGLNKKEKERRPRLAGEAATHTFWYALNEKAELARANAVNSGRKPRPALSQGEFQLASIKSFVSLGTLNGFQLHENFAEAAARQGLDPNYYAQFVAWQNNVRDALRALVPPKRSEGEGAVDPASGRQMVLQQVQRDDGTTVVDWLPEGNQVQAGNPAVLALRNRMINEYTVVRDVHNAAKAAREQSAEAQAKKKVHVSLRSQRV